MEGIDVETAGAVDIITNTFKLLLECQEEGEALGKQVSPSIYMVPRAFRDLNPSCFIPRVVSIGPLHREDEHLQGFEVQKKIYLHNWLRRLRVAPERTVRVCAEKVSQSIQRIKACYGELSNTYTDSELAKMMVIDACFILEFIWDRALQSYAERLLSRNHHTSSLIIYDMLLIENQIPFFVLEIIFDCTAVASGRLASVVSLTTFIKELLYFYKVFEENLVVSNASLGSTHDHILGFVHKCYQPLKEPVITAPAVPIRGHSAMNLDRAGVNFKPYGDENWAMAMKVESPAPLLSCFPNFMAIPQFSWLRWHTLKMPILKIHDNTELIIRNLIIYEQCNDIVKYVTSYVVAVDALIDTPEDVALLVRSKVLNNLMGSNEEAANMINNLGKNLPFNIIYNQQWKEIDDYYNSYWPNTIAGLKRTYFNNPWNIIALFAAFILFGLTITQTIFTIKAAYLTNETK